MFRLFIEKDFESKGGRKRKRKKKKEEEKEKKRKCKIIMRGKCYLKMKYIVAI